MWGADDPFVLKRLEGISTKPILSVANYLSLDADCIVAGSTDRSIRFYETVSMDEVMKTTMEKKNVSLVAVSGMSPEGDDPIIVTGGKDSVIQVWNPTASAPQHVIKLPTSEVKALAVYQGSRTLIAIGTRDSKVLIWDVGDDKLIATFEGHRASVYCICISVTSPDLEYTDDDMKSLCIASGGADRTVRTWDLVRGRRVKKFRHSRSISSIAVTNRGIRPLLASAGVERVIKIWDLDSGIQLRCLSGHLDQITTMTLWEGNQMFIISGSADHTIRIYDLISGECVCILKGHRDSVLSLTIADYDEPKIVSSSEDLSIIQWDLDAIISAFYDNSEDGEGARTPLPAYLPPVDYVAPAELDRSRLTKEERKRIRKERKKAKRLRNLQSFNAGKKSTRSSISNNNNNNNDDDDDDDLENYGSFVFDDDDDQDLAPEDEEPVVPPMISIPEAIKQAVEAVNDAMKATEEEILPAEPTKTPSKASLLRVVSNKVLPADAPAESSLQSVAGGLIKGILNRVFHTGQHNKVGIEPFPARDPSTDTDITPPTMESESTSIKKKSDETGVDDDNAATIDKDATTAREDGVEESKSIAATGFEAVHATVTAVVETTLAISIPTPSKPLIVGEDSGHNMVEYKSITRMKQESFSMAVADHKRETDRMKSQASEKLRNRLIMKQMRNSVGPFSSNSTEGGPTETDTTKGNGEGTGDANGNALDGGGEVIDAAAKSEFMRVKAEKLRQHKMQEMRRKESMMVSKNRSGLALQKRLEDLKTKRMQQAAEGGAGNKNDLVEMADEGEDDDDDDDNNSDNEAS